MVAIRNQLMYTVSKVASSCYNSSQEVLHCFNTAKELQNTHDIAHMESRAHGCNMFGNMNHIALFSWCPSAPPNPALVMGN